jgi:NAD(P)-dependent dehydrogenase (short-subunit alcohol dehydrogenase family)
VTGIPQTFSLVGRKALVTGTSGGLGCHFARVLAEAGASVILAGRQADKMAALQDELRKEGRDCSVVVFDAQRCASINALAPAMQDLDILVNNAGVARPAMALNQSEAQWDEVLDTNLKGLFFVAQAAGRVMQKHRRGGSIINIASVAGIRQGMGLLPYHVSKSGVIQLTKTLALEFARFNIRVNAIAPGSFPTEMTGGFWDSDEGKAMLQRIPQRRLGRLQDLDGPLLLLASEASAYMTGSVVTVDGGHLVSGL